MTACKRIQVNPKENSTANGSKNLKISPDTLSMIEEKMENNRELIGIGDFLNIKTLV